MLVDQDDVFYYITTLNENYPHPAMPEGAEEGILKGAYKLREVKADQPGLHVRLLGAGAILLALLASEIDWPHDGRPRRAPRPAQPALHSPRLAACD